MGLSLSNFPLLGKNVGSQSRLGGEALFAHGDSRIVNGGAPIELEEVRIAYRGRNFEQGGSRSEHEGNATSVGPPSNPTKSYAKAVLTEVADASKDEIDDNLNHDEHWRSKDMAIGAGDRGKGVAITTEDYVKHGARRIVPYFHRNKLYNAVHRSSPQHC
ncbi:hypothetical protein U1Q18_022210 [Sarracenia purpurea var. burkii]